MQTRTNNLDAIRYSLALLVLFSHSHPLLSGSDAIEPLMRLTGGAITLGSVAVAGFFVISGYLILQSWEHNAHPLAYIRKRMARIYPGYLAAAALSLLLVFALDGTGVVASLSVSLLVLTAALHFPSLPSALVALPFPRVINGSLWTIPYEALCYAIVPILSRRRRGVLILLGITCLLQFAILASPAAEYFLWTLHLNKFVPLLFSFLAGAALYHYRTTIPRSSALALIAVGSLLLSLLWPPLFVLLVPILGGYALIVLAFHPSISWHDFARRGDLSYGLYLYAFPIQQTLVFFFASYLSPMTLTLLAWPAAHACAWLSWHLVEAPALRAVRQETR
jgi:peptidoglycan/LPS O-acetylase OafA/YrhL